MKYAALTLALFITHQGFSMQQQSQSPLPPTSSTPLLHKSNTPQGNNSSLSKSSLLVAVMNGVAPLQAMKKAVSDYFLNQSE